MPSLGDGYVRSAEISCSGKSRSGAKTIHLGHDTLTISKLNNMELREITGTSRSKLNSNIQI
jgi:hypothetical protein